MAQLAATETAAAQLAATETAAMAQLAATETATAPASTTPTSTTTPVKFHCTACKINLASKGGLKKHMEQYCPHIERTQGARAKMDKSNATNSTFRKNKRKTNKAWKASECKRAAVTRAKQRVDKDIEARRVKSARS